MKIIIAFFIFAISVASNNMVCATQETDEEYNQQGWPVVSSTVDSGGQVAQLENLPNRWKYTKFAVGGGVLAVGAYAIYNYRNFECPEYISGQALELAHDATVQGKVICDFILDATIEFAGKCINATCTSDFTEGKVWGKIFKLYATAYDAYSGLPVCVYTRPELGGCALQYYNKL
jgi:hypothetical protein